MSLDNFWFIKELCMLQTMRNLKLSLTNVRVDHIERVLNTEESSKDYQHLFVSLINRTMLIYLAKLNNRTPKREFLLLLQTLNMQGGSSVW